MIIESTSTIINEALNVRQVVICATLTGLSFVILALYVKTVRELNGKKPVEVPEGGPYDGPGPILLLRSDHSDEIINYKSQTYYIHCMEVDLDRIVTILTYFQSSGIL